MVFDTVGPDGGDNKALATPCIGPKLGEHEVLPFCEVCRLERALELLLALKLGEVVLLVGTKRLPAQGV